MPRLKIALALAAVAVALTACSPAGASVDTGASASGATDGGTLVIGMTAAQLPGLDAGTYESEGWEGERFVGFQLYDGLTRMDLTQGETSPTIKPALAESWESSPDASTWTFHLRPGVKFHDGEPWNADAAVFGLDRLLNKDSPDFSAENASMISYYSQAIASYRKVDDMTLEIKTDGPYALLPQDLPFLVFPSPKAVKELGAGFAEKPVGTGPFSFVEMVPGERLVLARNESYWNGAPKLAKLILRPIPEATSRVASLRSGEVNWIEFPSPDDLKPLVDSGYQLFQNPYSHIWPWVFDVTSHGPIGNTEVRQALNYAIDRDSLAKNILSGTGVPAEQYVPAADPGYLPENDTLTYDPAKAKAMLAEAGYPNGFAMKVAYPTSGSGNMVPAPMNEALQKDLAAVGVTVELVPIEWATMIGDWYAGTMSAGADAMNISLGFAPPIAWEQTFGTGRITNVGKFSNAEFDALALQLRAAPDDKTRNVIYQKINAVLVQQAPWLVVVSDNNPRVLAPEVHGFVQSKSVWVDLTTVTVG
jgi:peptide/nickel transport system substrate-binding protein